MKILLVCFFFLGLSSILGDKYVVYKEDEAVPSLPTGARYGRTCRNIIGKTEKYCAEWDCPKTDCSAPIVPETGCPFCNGTCVYSGRVFRKDEYFTCDDGCNSCACNFNTGVYCATNDPPEVCKDYVK